MAQKPGVFAWSAALSSVEFTPASLGSQESIRRLATPHERPLSVNEDESVMVPTAASSHFRPSSLIMSYPTFFLLGIRTSLNTVGVKFNGAIRLAGTAR